ncbi:unnamed protein product [Allacma fusca]|uniref:PiggyBac transposable element-derived protein domain-containing protein n=1 Tax=Allacma fusca TaxID=39272 RepID=A0A8J2JMV6_9HEXA|nr:unnamed protein product [Allacma fusca]
MAKNYFGSGRGITADNFFGSREAAEELMCKKLTTVFTMRASRIEVPKEFAVHRNFELKESIFTYNGNCMLVAHKPKPSKVVLLMSTQHSLPNISRDEHKKPEVILFYNATKGGVDTVDQMAAEYSCQRKTRRWPLTTFMALLDVTCINAYILWMQLNPEWEIQNLGRRQVFLEQLSEALISPHLNRRSWVGLSKNIQDSMLIMGAPNPGKSTEGPSGRGYCEINNCRKRTTAKCSTCKKFACPEHAKNCVFLLL